MTRDSYFRGGSADGQVIAVAIPVSDGRSMLPKPVFAGPNEDPYMPTDETIDHNGKTLPVYEYDPSV